MNEDKPLEASESDSETLESSAIWIPNGGPPQLSTAISGPLKGTHRLAYPDADLPYTLEGEVWSIELIKTLQTGWFGINGPLTVGEILPVIYSEILNVQTSQYMILVNSMQEYGQRVPIHISEDKKRLRDGIHRIALAVSPLKWNTMLVSSDRRSWHEWDESEIGQEYHRLWRRRLGLPG